MNSSFLVGIERLGVKKYVAKIGMDNVPSICMFAKLGFSEVSFIFQWTFHAF